MLVLSGQYTEYPDYPSQEQPIEEPPIQDPGQNPYEQKPEEPKKSGMKKYIIVGAVILAIVLAFLFISGQGNNSESSSDDISSENEDTPDEPQEECDCPEGKTCSEDKKSCVDIPNEPNESEETGNNGECDEGENCFDNPTECKCADEEYCSNETKECARIVCGNDVCEESENSTSCCLDCLCFGFAEFCNETSKACEANQSLVDREKARILATAYLEEQGYILEKLDYMGDDEKNGKTVWTFAGDVLGEKASPIIQVDSDFNVIYGITFSGVIENLSFNSPIISPKTNRTFDNDTLIFFASDTVSGTPPYSITWTSNISGFISDKPDFIINGLSIGIHNITLETSDSGGNKTQSSISIEIVDKLNRMPRDNDSLASYVISPVPNQTYYKSDFIDFFGIAYGGVPPYSFEWKSNDSIWSSLGNMSRFSFNGIDPGKYNLTFSVTDYVGNKSEYSLEIEILNEIPGNDSSSNESSQDNDLFFLQDANISLAARIGGPCMVLPDKTISCNNLSFARGKPMSFKVRIYGGKPPYEIEWKSDIAGTMIRSSSAVLSYNALGLGTHIVTASVKDSEGNVAEANTTVNVIRENNSQVTYPCVPVKVNGPPEDKVDVVFLGSDYSDMDEFYFFMEKHIEDLLYFEPFKSNSNKINFYFVNISLNLECKPSDNTSKATVRCDNFRYIENLTSYCPNNYIIVLANIFAGRANAPKNIAIIPGFDYDSTTTHEFGHSFGNLADEYVYDHNVTFGGEHPNINCDSDPSCSKWKDVPNTFCLPGCGYDDIYRPTETCLMRSGSKEVPLEPSGGVANVTFCPVCFNHLNKLFQNYE